MTAAPSADLPRHELDRLMALATGRSRRVMLAEPRPLTADERIRLDRLIERRSAGEPLQYLEGTVQFGPIELAIDRRALIPRPETEQLWELAVRALGEAGPVTVVVDLCTGSGNLALALKHAFPAAQVFATDSSTAALALAEENAQRTGLTVEFLHGDLLEPLPKRLEGRIDLLVANPPYVSEAEFRTLPVEVRDHEPYEALVAGPAGDEVLRRIADDGFWWLGVGGWLVVEIGDRQAERAQQIFGAFDSEVHQDLAGRPRILIARKGASCCL